MQRWCSDELFCAKMTAHWKDCETWLHGRNKGVYKEIWDGDRFAELRLWNPEEWLLPTRCITYREVISASTILEALDDHGEKRVNMQTYTYKSIKCPFCADRFNHCLQYARGDPRNIALNGHWDGWQPFSTSAKHSCGNYKLVNCGSLGIIIYELL